MNTTHKVSIGGIAFVVDESAYAELRSYTDKLHVKFNRRPDGQEIINDIEYRIAELLSSKLTSTEQVVTLFDVKDILERLGDPYEMDEGEEKADKGYEENTNTVSRRLYRSASNRVIAGVCGGLGAYFNIDPVFVRIAFVALTLIGSAAFFGWFFIIVYIVIWISTPIAFTVSQKLQMEGKKVNLSTIEQRIREEAQNISPQVKSAGEGFLHVVGVLFKVVAIFFISVFLLVGLAISTVLLVSLFGVDPATMGSFITISNDADFAIFNIVYSFFPHLFWFKFWLMLLFVIPTILLIVLMIKLIFNARVKTRYVVIPLTIIWFVALFGSLFTGISSLKTSFGGNSSVSETINAPAPIDTLTIGYNGNVALNPADVLITLKNNNDDNESFSVNINGEDVVNIRGTHKNNVLSIDAIHQEGNKKISKNSTVYIRPAIDVEYDSNISTPQVVVKKWATGRNYATATNNAESINFTATFNGKTLLVTPAIPLQLNERILKGVEVTVLLPTNTSYKLDNAVLSTTSLHGAKRENGVYVNKRAYYNDENEPAYVDTVVVK